MANFERVSPAARARLHGILSHYAHDPHPFTACVRDNRERFGPERAQRVCAVVKDLIYNSTHWRNGGEQKLQKHYSDELEATLPDFFVAFLEEASDRELAEALGVDERTFAELTPGHHGTWKPELHPRYPKGHPLAGRFMPKAGGGGGSHRPRRRKRRPEPHVEVGKRPTKTATPGRARRRLEPPPRRGPRGTPAEAAPSHWPSGEYRPGDEVVFVADEPGVTTLKMVNRRDHPPDTGGGQVRARWRAMRNPDTGEEKVWLVDGWGRPSETEMVEALGWAGSREMLTRPERFRIASGVGREVKDWPYGPGVPGPYQDIVSRNSSLFKDAERRAKPRLRGEVAIDVGEDLDRAARLLSRGKKVRLDQPRQVSTLLAKLGALTAEAKAKGENAPTYDLCNVTVKDSNLFCLESKGIPRIQMPQLSGVPTAGSAADKLQHDTKGEVNLGPEFVSYLRSKGIKVNDESEYASYLRPSQNQLNGAKVAGMMKFMESGGKIPGSIFVSKDNYVVDGHHRWAAEVGIDTADNETGDVEMPVQRIDMSITELLAEANRFAEQWGIPQAGVEAGVGGKKYVEREYGARHWTPDLHPRNRDGKFRRKGSGLTGGSSHHPGPGKGRRQRKALPHGYAVLSGDLPGFTRRTEENENETLKQVGTYTRASAKVVNAHGGSVLGIYGDGVIATFTDPDQALEAAREINAETERIERENPGFEVTLRLSIAAERGKLSILDDDDMKKRYIAEAADFGLNRHVAPGKIGMDEATAAALATDPGPEELVLPNVETPFWQTVTYADEETEKPGFYQLVARFQLHPADTTGDDSGDGGPEGRGPASSGRPVQGEGQPARGRLLQRGRPPQDR